MIGWRPKWNKWKTSSWIPLSLLQVHSRFLAHLIRGTDRWLVLKSLHGPKRAGVTPRTGRRAHPGSGNISYHVLFLTVTLVIILAVSCWSILCAWWFSRYLLFNPTTPYEVSFSLVQRRKVKPSEAVSCSWYWTSLLGFLGKQSLRWGFCCKCFVWEVIQGRRGEGARRKCWRRDAGSATTAAPPRPLRSVQKSPGAVHPVAGGRDTDALPAVTDWPRAASVPGNSWAGPVYGSLGLRERSDRKHMRWTLSEDSWVYGWARKETRCGLQGADVTCRSIC